MFIPGAVLMSCVGFLSHLRSSSSSRTKRPGSLSCSSALLARSGWVSPSTSTLLSKWIFYSSDALVKGCGHMCTAVLIICYCTVILGVGAFWSLKDKGIDESSPLYFSISIGCYYLVMITQWFVTHNVYVRFDPSRTMFKRAHDSPRQQG